MELSILICTHNRARVLADALDSLFESDLDPAWRFEVLIVDNASSDETPTVAKMLCAKYPGRLKYELEKKLGKVHALNTGIGCARGKTLAIADDDIFFDIHWMRNAFDFLASHPDADCVAGRIDLLFEQGKPKWLSEDPPWLNMIGMYSGTNFGETERQLGLHETPIGANVLFRMHVFDRIGGFNPAFGRVGKCLLSNEEGEFHYRFCQAGLKAVYAPSIAVRHRIGPDRTRKSWLLRRFYWQGISGALFEQVTQPGSRVGLLRMALRDLAKLLSVLVGGSFHPRSIWWNIRGYRFWHAAYGMQVLGVVRQRLRMALRPPSNPKSLDLTELVRRQ